jgi:hypothetical protein
MCITNFQYKNSSNNIFSSPTIEDKISYDYNMPPVFDDYGDENNYSVESAPTTIVHVGSINHFTLEPPQPLLRNLPNLSSARRRPRRTGEPQPPLNLDHPSVPLLPPPSPFAPLGKVLGRGGGGGLPRSAAGQRVGARSGRPSPAVMQERRSDSGDVRRHPGLTAAWPGGGGQAGRSGPRWVRLTSL